MSADTATSWEDVPTAPIPPLFELRGVSRSYRTGGGVVHALAGIDLIIGPGELLAIEGPSGSGKSTLLQLLGALDRPTSGSARFDGRELSEMSDAQLTSIRSRHIGFVFQAFNLIPTLSAAENVQAAMVPLGLSSAQRRDRSAEVLELVGLAGRASHLPSRLSGGEQQRVAIARALANHPRVILADEPTGNLDTGTAGEVVDTLRGLVDVSGVTVVVVTHSEELASRTARRVRLRDGRIVTSWR
ncbi:MAG TPA: ABC transporter ATP-binding protein [Mycobacteriales bacterium]|nr:ABC transporter ATP-binding protein [Mycobacteriales bacterium]